MKDGKSFDLEYVFIPTEVDSIFQDAGSSLCYKVAKFVNPRTLHQINIRVEGLGFSEVSTAYNAVVRKLRNI